MKRSSMRVAAQVGRHRHRPRCARRCAGSSHGIAWSRSDQQGHFAAKTAARASTWPSTPRVVHHRASRARRRPPGPCRSPRGGCRGRACRRSTSAARAGTGTARGRAGSADWRSCSFSCSSCSAWWRLAASSRPSGLACFLGLWLGGFQVAAIRPCRWTASARAASPAHCSGYSTADTAWRTGSATLKRASATIRNTRQGAEQQHQLRQGRRRRA